MNQEEEKYIEVLNQCAETCKEKYCFFKMFMESKHVDLRVICQIKCVEIFKWEKSAQAHDDIGWKKAWDLWVEEGYAVAFSQAYDVNNPYVSIREVYSKMISILKNNKVA